MAAKLVWTPKARADVKSIYLHIGAEQPRSAERYFERFRYKAGLLAEHPRLGERTGTKIANSPASTSINRMPRR